MDYIKKVVIKDSLHISNLENAFRADTTLQPVYQGLTYKDNELKLSLDSIAQEVLDAVELVFSTYFDAQDDGSLTISDIEVDDDGRQVTKAATTYKGWRYYSHPIEITTGDLNSAHSTNWDGSAKTDYEVGFYDENNAALLTQEDIDASCVKTTIAVKTDYDFDLIGGEIHQHTAPTEDVRIWVIAGILEIPVAPYIKEFIGGVNMKFISAGSHLRTDGRASARMNLETEGVPCATNQVQYIIRHPVGCKHSLMILMEYFRQ